MSFPKFCDDLKLKKKATFSGPLLLISVIVRVLIALNMRIDYHLRSAVFFIA